MIFNPPTSAVFVKNPLRDFRSIFAESVAHTAAADAGLFHDGTLQPREDAASSALGPACRQEGEPHHWDGGYYPRPQPRGRAHHAALSQIPFSTWLHVASPYQEC